MKGCVMAESIEAMTRQLKVTPGPLWHQGATASAQVTTLGLRKIFQSVVRDESPSVRGLIATVRHLVTVEKSEMADTENTQEEGARRRSCTTVPLARRQDPRGRGEASRVRPPVAVPKGTKGSLPGPSGFEEWRMPPHMRLQAARLPQRVEFQPVGRPHRRRAVPRGRHDRGGPRRQGCGSPREPARPRFSAAATSPVALALTVDAWSGSRQGRSRPPAALTSPRAERRRARPGTVCCPDWLALTSNDITDPGGPGNLGRRGGSPRRRRTARRPCALAAGCLGSPRATAPGRDVKMHPSHVASPSQRPGGSAR